MIERRKTRQVSVGNVKIGGDAPISVQSMLNTKTTDVEGSIAQINALKAVGCDLIRLAVPDEDSARAFGEIAKRCGLPLIADIHYNYKLAHMALDAGAKKIRMNPGNMRDFSQIKPLAQRMIDMGIPVRVGVNGGSLDPKFKGMDEARALCESALECANVFESVGMKDIVIAIKASDTMLNIKANRLLASTCDYPLHIGVTEAGTLRTGLVKSAIGIGALLEEGIGDTIRVSLSTNVCEEVLAGKKIPSRDKVLRLLLGLQAELSDCQKILQLYGYRPLYPRIFRDVLLISSITNSLSLSQVQQLLEQHQEEPLK